MSHHNCRHQFTTRREFLRTTLLGGALSWTVPSFVSQTFSTLHAATLDAATQTVTGKDAPILILLQLAGGNDGLNTVVPYTNDNYYRARPTLNVPAKSVLSLNDTIGLAPQLQGFKSLYDEGHFGVIQGVGYPNPNRSHFRSTEIWHTAVDSNQVEKYGWLGRYFDNACAGADPTVGINIGRQMPQAFTAKHPMGVCLDNPQNYRFNAGSVRQDGSAGSTEAAYRELNQVEEMTGGMAAAGGNDNEGGSIGAVTGSIDAGQHPLDFLERTALDAQVSSDEILRISRTVKNTFPYPQSGLASQLRLISNLIAGGLPTRVFYLSHGGFDTHNNQTGTHERLLTELGDAVKAFCDDLKAQGNLDRVLLMTFSEFGRRVKENGSKGTDHGTAAPLFFAGGKTKAGVYGALPSLAPEDLDDGDLKFTTDFRSIYATVLEDWLKTSPAAILGKSFPKLDFV